MIIAIVSRLPGWLPVLTTRARREERDYAMWSEGYHLGEDETDTALLEKDAFIETQAARLAAVAALREPVIDWARVPTELRDALCDYV